MHFHADYNYAQILYDKNDLSGESAPGEVLTLTDASALLAGADQFAQNSGARIVLPAVLGNASAAVEDNTQLWRLDSIAEELNTLAMEFAETVKKDGFTAAGWTEYYQKLQQAGLSEYTQFMQKRAG